jgi:hypothetical protein
MPSSLPNEAILLSVLPHVFLRIVHRPEGANFRLDVRESGMTGLAAIHAKEVSHDIAGIQRRDVDV